MTIALEPIPFDEIREEMRGHLAGLTSAIDSYLESHILESNHYRVVVGTEVAGFASIHGGSVISQFALRPAFRRHGQDAFARLRRMEEVTAAFVATSDEFSLSNALDSYRELRKQAYFFARPPGLESITPDGFSLYAAVTGDAGLIGTESGDFFDRLPEGIDRGEVYLVRREGEVVGFGVMERSVLQDDTASIGMYAIDRFRGQGVGTATIRLLIAESGRQGIRPVAGCWYYNHASKRTLERAGMYAASRLLRVEF